MCDKISNALLEIVKTLKDCSYLIEPVGVFPDTDPVLECPTIQKTSYQNRVFIEKDYTQRIPLAFVREFEEYFGAPRSLDAACMMDLKTSFPDKEICITENQYFVAPVSLKPQLVKDEILKLSCRTPDISTEIDSRKLWDDLVKMIKVEYKETGEPEVCLPEGSETPCLINMKSYVKISTIPYAVKTITLQITEKNPDEDKIRAEIADVLTERNCFDLIEPFLDYPMPYQDGQ